MNNINSRRLATSTIISSLIIIAIIIDLFHLPLLSVAIEIQTDESKRIILIHREDSNDDGAATNGGAFSLQIGGVLFSPSPNNNEQWRVHLSNICRQQQDHPQDKEVEVACQYDAMLQRVQSTAIVEMNRLKSSSFYDHGVDDDERDYSDEIEYNTAIIEQLSLLASFHKLQLDNADALGLTFATTDDELLNNDDDYSMSIGKMHYHRSLGTLLSSEYY